MLRIFIMNPLGSANRFLTLIVVPKDIRCIMFHAYHTASMGAHMRRYKKLLLFSGQARGKISSRGLVGVQVVSQHSKEYENQQDWHNRGLSQHHLQ